MSRFLRFVFAGSLVAVPVWVWAQQSAPRPIPAVLAAPSASTPGNVVIENAKIGGTSSFNYETGVGLITKDVVLRQVGEKFVLRAQRVRYSKSENRATATGDLKVETENSTIRGAQMFGDFNAKIISFTGNVVISAHGRNDGMKTNSSARKPVRIACNRLDWNYTTRLATIVGNIRMVQDDNVGTCNRIIYNEPQNAVNLLGDVRFGNSKRQQFIGDDVVIYLDESRIVTNKGVVMRSGDGAGTGKSAPPKAKPPTAFPNRTQGGSVEALPAAPPPIAPWAPTPKPKPTATPQPAPKTEPDTESEASNEKPA